jgi:hypothetical protein
MAGEWVSLAGMIDEEEGVRIGEVDCTVSKNVCEDYGVRGFPTLKYFKTREGAGVDYKGKREALAFRVFIEEQQGGQEL